MTDHLSESNFEQALARLEVILERMNAGDVSLDESLLLYEEADRLIRACNKRLSEAETKVEMLIKKRNGELEVDEAEQPKRALFATEGVS